MVIVDVVAGGGLLKAVVLVVVGRGDHNTADLEGVGSCSGVDDVVAGLTVSTVVVVVTVCTTVMS